MQEMMKSMSLWVHKRENLVFEYVNINLHKFIQQYHPMDSHLIKKFLYCILSGISYCHARKIIHRDLTTMNLLADIENKTVKIAADSGMAKEIDAPFDAHTTEMVILRYRAPKILFGRTNCFAAIDMWAVLYLLRW
ncbi:hypothetical protein CISIN_1g043346mg [Citrus sinensis]|uniref:cyclin-dependent kinase n=1 Tax=Citrus sinensis TaxID=2711 RepID=A0A067DKS9_CITSI|nr:hypothetical protein CISIN_1g043346mg [Citrus sinensis]